MSKTKTSIVRERQNQWSKDIGESVNPKSGKQTDKRWYFGHVSTTAKADADALASLIMAEWKVIKLRGGDVWPAETIQRFELMRQGMTDQQAAEVMESPPPSPSSAVAPRNDDNSAASSMDDRQLYALMAEYEQSVVNRGSTRSKSANRMSEQLACICG